MKPTSSFFVLFLLSFQLQSQITIDSIFNDLYEYHAFSYLSEGITELYFTEQGLVVNQGKDGMINLYRPEISDLAFFDHITSTSTAFSETFSPSSATTRSVDFGTDSTIFYVVKEKDLVANLLDFYDPEIQVIKLSEGEFFNRTINVGYLLDPTNPDSEIISPYDVIQDLNGDLFIYSKRIPFYFGNHYLCKQSHQMEQTECVEIEYAELKFFQNHLGEIFFICEKLEDPNATSAYFQINQINGDLSSDSLLRLDGYVDIQIYDKDKVIIGKESGFDIYTENFSEKLYSISYPLEGNQYAAVDKDIYINHNGTVVNLDENYNSLILHENQCSNHSYSGIKVNEDHVYIYGGKKNGIQQKAINRDPNFNNENLYGVVALQVVNNPQVIPAIIPDSFDPTYSYDLHFSTEVVVINNGTEVIDSIELVLEVENHFTNNASVKYSNLHLEPDSSSILQFNTLLTSSFQQSCFNCDDLFQFLPDIYPDKFDIEVFKVNEFFPCDKTLLTINETDILIDQDGDGVYRPEDCDDNNPLVFDANADEICDGIDNNCDGVIDEGIEQITYYMDEDLDGYGDGPATMSCDTLIGYSTLDGDCNDFDPSINPGAEDIAGDGLDLNCDGIDGPSLVYNQDILSIDIYPNPTLNQIYLSSEIQEFKYELYDVKGAIILKGKCHDVINVEVLKTGFYYLKLVAMDGSGAFVGKVIKE